jgi:adenylate cyclase
MGDAVNLGSRLETANQEYGTSIMIGENSYQMAKSEIIVRQLDLLRVKGKTEPVKVYELAGMVETGIPAAKQQVMDIFAKGMESYLEQNWAVALNYFNQALTINRNDQPSKTYIKRCEQFAANPPGEAWDGVFTMLTKG